MLEYFAAPPAITCAQQTLQTLWGRRGLGRRGFGEGVTCGKAWFVERAWLVEKAWLVWEGMACGARVPRPPGTNPGSCFTFLIWTDVMLIL